MDDLLHLVSSWWAGGSRTRGEFFQWARQKPRRILCLGANLGRREFFFFCINPGACLCKLHYRTHCVNSFVLTVSGEQNSTHFFYRDPGACICPSSDWLISKKRRSLSMYVHTSCSLSLTNYATEPKKT
jgi:hypothetical protein